MCIDQLTFLQLNNKDGVCPVMYLVAFPTTLTVGPSNPPIVVIAIEESDDLAMVNVMLNSDLHGEGSSPV